MKLVHRPTALRLEHLEDRTVLSVSNHLPVLTLTAAPTSPLVVLANGSYLTNQATLQIQGATLPGQTVNLDLAPDTKFLDGSVVAGPTGQFTLTANLTEGLNRIWLRVIDGKQVKTFRLLATRDDQPSNIVVTHPTPGQDINHVPQIRGVIGDAFDHIAHLQASVDGGPLVTEKVNAAGGFAFFPSLPTSGADGTHTVQLRATDQAGNVGTTSISFVLDTVAPTLTVSQPAPGLITSQNPTITGQVSDSGTGAATLWVAVDSGAWKSLTYNGSGNFTFTTAEALNGVADGTHVVHFLATDKAHNLTTTNYTFVLDTTPPVVVVKQPGPGLITNTNPTITGKVRDLANDVSGLQASVDGGAATPVTVDATGHFTFAPTLALDGTADGSHTVTFVAADQAGNQSKQTSYTFTLQTKAPTVTTNLSQINGTTIDGVLQGSQITFTFSAPLTPATLNTANFYLTGPKGVVPLNVVVAPDDQHVTLSGTGLLPVGSYTFTVNAPAITDLAGNTLGTSPLTWTFDVSRTYNWTNTAGGDWSNPANWDRGQVPGPYDNAVINVAGNVVITHSQGTDTIADLTSSNAIQLTGGVLAVTGTVQISNTFTLAGGTLRGATVLPGAGGQGITLTSTGGVLDHVTTSANIDGTQVTGATVSIINGLTLNNATILLGNTDFGSFTSASLVFANSPGQVGPQLLGGTGTVIFGGSSVNTILANHGLQIGSSVTIDGASGALVGSIVNNGIISANVMGGTIMLDASSGNGVFLNQGRMDAHNGGSLTATGQTLLENNGVLTAGDGSSVVCDGSFTQGSNGLIRVEEMDGTPADGGNFSILGTATLAGTFKEVFTNGYVPASGDGGKVLKYGAYTGSFTTVMTSRSLTIGLTLQSSYGVHGFHVVYS
jgi:hypothetical protein